MHRRVVAGGGAAPYTFTIVTGTLPTGLTLDPNGLLSGTSTVSGTFGFTVQARDVNDFIGTQAYTLKVIRGSTTRLSTSSNPVVLDQVISITATVAATFNPAMGSVTFTEKAVTLGVVALSDGQASISMSWLLPGPHVITATYSGDAHNIGSVSTVLIVFVNPRPLVAAGEDHTCTVRTDGMLGCWGYNGSAQTNVPTTTQDAPFVQIDAGSSHTCAVKTDGTLACWGSSYGGYTNIPPTVSPFVQVSDGRRSHLRREGRRNSGLLGSEL